MENCCQSCVSRSFSADVTLRGRYNVWQETGREKVIALAGNPNVGKTTVFNSLTGMRQHTGNWPGKTVTQAQGRFVHDDHSFLLVDLPGTYSLLAHSTDEQVARDFICFGRPDATIVVVDATCLARNLNLALQVMEITNKVVLCVNLLDEAESKGIRIDLEALSEKLGVPVVGTAARSGRGLDALKEALCRVATGQVAPAPLAVAYDEEVRAAMEQLLPRLEPLLQALPHLNPRWVAMRLLDGDEQFLDSLTEHTGAGQPEAKEEVLLCPQ
ncbi:iron transporter FeoB [Heliobacterium gestii]|uniref:Iron transporter FeoB n=1 Tax=Heliomicrobium gestii TaxID=2699 RepID=A0A845LL94_HELGE|nr:FeoB small GTPase domain-containing protein [Heliomicrobium gestii]MBM7867349.1 ferrous iron transport protein B [Heliomicrobium gestii]MZP43616.1 iron transporter FeoB [Heliomicrobium gestii]